MDNVLGIESFIIASKAFREKLAAAENFTQMLNLWRSTSIPYHYSNKDPASTDYRSEVLDVYRRLTDGVYDPSSEITSSKQDSESFEIGFPWITGNLDIVSLEIAKVVQAMRALHEKRLDGSAIIEFGAGWGNLAIPLARARQNVTIVDIDHGFINRVLKTADREGLSLGSIQGNFHEVAEGLKSKYKAVIFQASFHHCLEFDKLITAIRDNVLEDDGVILFFSEPIFKNYTFPWGLRYDGESLWAIMINKWLELGFDRDFFIKMMLDHGFFLSIVEPVQNYIGEGWSAVRGHKPFPFEELQLPQEYDESFYSSQNLRGFGRFCREQSTLPGLDQCILNNYELVFHNYSRSNLKVTVDAGISHIEAELIPQSSIVLSINAKCDKILIRSETYIPSEEEMSTDGRALGAALMTVRLCA